MAKIAIYYNLLCIKISLRYIYIEGYKINISQVLKPLYLGMKYTCIFLTIKYI